MKYFITILFVLGLTFLYGQERVKDSTIIFVYNKNGKTINIKNNYKVTLEMDGYEPYESTPICVQYIYGNTDSLVVECDASYISFPNRRYDSTSTLKFIYQDFSVSMEFLPISRYSSMTFGVFIYEFTNKIKFKKYKNSNYGIVHPDSRREFKKEDFPLILVAIYTEEFISELEIR
tara:strand:- start:89 stop:616 length:528 start_codon:yes stop_codon:yes gene_type:complete